jgi:alkylhydroperoxidase family enzyme
MLIVLNKIDLIPAAERAAKLAKVQARIRKQLTGTEFESAQFVAVAAAPGDALAVTDVEAEQTGPAQELAPAANVSISAMLTCDHCSSNRLSDG